MPDHVRKSILCDQPDPLFIIAHHCVPLTGTVNIPLSIIYVFDIKAIRESIYQLASVVENLLL